MNRNMEAQTENEYPCTRVHGCCVRLLDSPDEWREYEHERCRPYAVNNIVVRCMSPAYKTVVSALGGNAVDRQSELMCALACCRKSMTMVLWDSSFVAKMKSVYWIFGIVHTWLKSTWNECWCKRVMAVLVTVPEGCFIAKMKESDLDL